VFHLRKILIDQRIEAFCASRLMVRPNGGADDYLTWHLNLAGSRATVVGRIENQFPQACQRPNAPP
jgi:hypothetical protein